MAAVTFMSCQKEEISTNPGNEISDSQAQNEGKYKKEIIVTDESGKNQAFYAIYSDDEQILNQWIEAQELSLNINETDVEKMKSADLTSKQKHNPEDLNNFDLTQKPKITVDLIFTNLQENVTSYSLEVKSKSTRDFVYGYPVVYTTQNNFIGTVHRSWGYEFACKLQYKKGSLSSWNYVTNGNGTNTWFVYAGQPYWCQFATGDYYKRGIVIYPHKFQNGVNYYIAYSRNDFRSRTCPIGTYDYNNYGECYVGSSPVGTTAFVWGASQSSLAFYYTPVNGNQCPMPGTWFDGANCFYMNVPASYEPYTWTRNWLVKSNIIN